MRFNIIQGLRNLTSMGNEALDDSVFMGQSGAFGWAPIFELKGWMRNEILCKMDMHVFCSGLETSSSGRVTI